MVKRLDSGYQSFSSTTKFRSPDSESLEISSSSRSNSLNTPTSPYENSVFQPISPAESPESNDILAPVIPKAQQAVLAKADTNSEKNCQPVPCSNQDELTEKDMPVTKSQTSSVVGSDVKKPVESILPTLYRTVPSSVPTAIQVMYQPTKVTATNQSPVDPKPMICTSQGAVNIPGIPLYPIVLGGQANSAVSINQIYQPVFTASALPTVIAAKNVLPNLQSFCGVQPVTTTTPIFSKTPMAIGI